MGCVTATTPPLSSEGHTTPRLSAGCAGPLHRLLLSNVLKHKNCSPSREGTVKNQEKKKKPLYHFYTQNNGTWRRTPSHTRPPRPRPTVTISRFQMEELSRWKSAGLVSGGAKTHTDSDSQPGLSATSLHRFLLQEPSERLLMAREDGHDSMSSKKQLHYYMNTRSTEG